MPDCQPCLAQSIVKDITPVICSSALVLPRQVFWTARDFAQQVRINLFVQPRWEIPTLSPIYILQYPSCKNNLCSISMLELTLFCRREQQPKFFFHCWNSSLFKKFQDKNLKSSICQFKFISLSAIIWLSWFIIKIEIHVIALKFGAHALTNLLKQNLYRPEY